MAKGKAPAFQFYVGDWLQDTRALSLSAKGAWIDILCALWRSSSRGTLTLPLIGWARLIGGTVEQTNEVISELRVNGFILVKNNCDTITIINVWFRKKLHQGQRRPSIPVKIRRLVLSVGRCAYCGNTENLTIDHIIPYSKGGKHNISNFQCLCFKCNRKKSDRLE